MDQQNNAPVGMTAFGAAVCERAPFRLFPITGTGSDKGDLAIKIFPVRLGSSRKFADKVALVASMKDFGNLSQLTAGSLATVIGSVSELIEESLVGVVNVGDRKWERVGDGCVKLDELSQEYWPEVAQRWVDMSWTEDKLRPWVGLLEAIVQKVTGEKPSLWTMVSTRLSAAATAATTSSNASAPAGPTQAGASPSSEPTSTPAAS